MKYGKPEGFTQRVLCLLGDTLGFKNQLGVLGFVYNPMINGWTRQKFSPHTIDSIKNINEDIELSDAVIEEYRVQNKLSLPRIYENRFNVGMLLDYQVQAEAFMKKANSGVVALDIGLGGRRA
jgi:hypothetical protein